jgi:LCP family protein required for cell wall assembly
MTGGGKKKKKKHRKLRLALEIIFLLVLALGIFAAAQLSRMDRVKLSDILVNSGIGKSGYRNIALFGVDSRSGELESGTNSDTIMVASINEKTGDIKLVSVYRDTYLDHTNGTYGKATECFSGGGAERAVNMLNKNLDLDIEDFVTVDFNGVIEAVDLLGGIELDITEEERGWLNGYLVETSQVTGVSYDEVASAGTQTVTGIQAMAYCRIRYTEGWDYKRTERQRTVLEKVFEKAKAKGVTGLLPLVNTMMDYISTSLSNTELLALAAGISRYNITETTGFPFDYQAADISAGDCVVPVNLAANVSQLHQYLFGESDYTASDTVQEISNQIIWNTGIQ